jgi:hypothetical protein
LREFVVALLVVAAVEPPWMALTRSKIWNYPAQVIPTELMMPRMGSDSLLEDFWFALLIYTGVSHGTQRFC